MVSQGSLSPQFSYLLTCRRRDLSVRFLDLKCIYTHQGNSLWHVNAISLVKTVRPTTRSLTRTSRLESLNSLTSRLRRSMTQNQVKRSVLNLLLLPSKLSIKWVFLNSLERTLNNPNHKKLRAPEWGLFFCLIISLRQRIPLLSIISKMLHNRVKRKINDDL